MSSDSRTSTGAFYLKQERQQILPYQNPGKGGTRKNKNSKQRPYILTIKWDITGIRNGNWDHIRWRNNTHKMNGKTSTFSATRLRQDAGTIPSTIGVPAFRTFPMEQVDVLHVDPAFRVVATGFHEVPEQIVQRLLAHLVEPAEAVCVALACQVDAACFREAQGDEVLKPLLPV